MSLAARARAILGATALWALVAGCPQAHLSPGYGESYRAAFEQQVMYPTAGAGERAPLGWDSQESAIIADQYLRSLSTGKGGLPEEEQIMLMEPGAQGIKAILPAPSVPKDERK